MTDAFARVLARYNARAGEEEAAMRADPLGTLARRDDLLLHVGEPVGRVLQALAEARGATRIAEFGTSYGYSTLFLAAAARATGGRVVTFELAPDKQAYARAQLDEAGLADVVDWRCGDAVALIEAEAGPFDFVLIDLWKDLYVPIFQGLSDKLAESGLIAADNMLFPPDARAHAEAYRAAVRADRRFQSTLLPIGHGIELSCFWPGQAG